MCHFSNLSYFIASVFQENPYFLRGCAYYVGDNTPNMSYDQLAARFLKSSGFELSYRKGKMPFWLFYCGVILLYYVTTLINMFGKIFGKTVKVGLCACKVPTSQDDIPFHLGVLKPAACENILCGSYCLFNFSNNKLLSL